MHQPTTARTASKFVAVFLLISSGCFATPPAPQSTVENQTDQMPEKKITNDPPQHTNALAKETSPYLLMHAHNPVDWHAWNDETLARAKQTDKLIFLSIGYSSCHWCHVMERESFLDPEIAKFLNEHFICIKVDREERPDVDEIYMEALHVYHRLSGNNQGGGWPLTMFLLPDGRPFFGGTYFPARTGDRGDLPGFLPIIQQVHELTKNERANVAKDAELITNATRESLSNRESVADMELKNSWLKRAVAGLSDSFDPQFGGFGFQENDPQVPKFPEASNLLFLLYRSQSNAPDSDRSREMLVKTCEQMLQGGIYDHLGGGFHRYSVDRFWRIPHYEKMLYDNGQLASVYAEAYGLTERPEFKTTVEGILSFVDRELTSDTGGFYASLDAESEGIEGKFYVWDLDEIKTALNAEEYILFAGIYGLNGAPNFEGKHYAPQLSRPLSEHAKQLGISELQLESQLNPIRQKLFAARSQRVRPLLDHKILTAWNGMMIRGYADAGRLLSNNDYLQTSSRAAKFALANLVDERGRLVRTSTDGTARLNAYLDDYACLIDGLLGLHRATGDDEWLQAAKRLQQQQDDLFWDEQNGGYFYTSSDHEVLIARSKKPIDSAVPAGNSVSAGNLLYLATALDDASYRDRARHTVISASPIVQRMPIAAPRLLITAGELLKAKSN